MPISEERPGLFRGTRFNTTSWYIVAPIADPELVIERWRSNFDPTNSSRARRRLAGFAAWTLFAAVAIAIVLSCAHFATSSPPLAIVIGGAGLIALIGSAIGVVLLHEAIVGEKLPLTQHVPWVAAIREDVQQWASDDTPIADIWNLTSALARVTETQTVLREWGEFWDEETQGDRPDWAINALIEPPLRASLGEHRRAAQAVATQLGVELEQFVSADPQPVGDTTST